MKRLVLVLATPLLLVACGGARSTVPPHIVAVGAPVGAAAEQQPAVTLPPITVPAPVAPAVRREAPRASRSTPRAAPVAITGDIWGALARCESGGNPRSVSGNGKYFGAFQFSLATWQGLGYAGNPTDYPYATQLAAAQKLQARSGWGQWPVCARKLGLR